MIVTFHHTHAYDWETITEAQPGDVVATNLRGDLTRRISVPSTHTEVKFAPGAVELIQTERAASPDNRRPLGAKAITAELLMDGAAASCFDNAHLTDITIDPPDQDLRTYLLDHFSVTPKEKS